MEPGLLPRHSDVASDLPKQHLNHPPNTSILLLEHHSFVVSSGLSTVKPVFHLNMFISVLRGANSQAN